MSVPCTVAVPEVGAAEMAAPVNGPLVALSAAWMVTDLPASTWAVCAAATGTAPGMTVTETTAAAEVPPGPVAVYLKLSSPK